MVHAPQLGLTYPKRMQAIQAEFNALLTGLCCTCGDELENGKSINGQCVWCLQVAGAYRPLG